MIALFTAFSLAHNVETPVRATLADGQVLMGQVRTRILRLVTGAGLVDVPLSDVGEVRPSENRQLGKDDHQVNVWLRNGSELRGTWSEPELAMGISVGGDKVGVDLPMEELTRFQLQGQVAWPDSPVYRVQTTWGDDFLIDPAGTRLQLENQLGSFSPSLAECRSAAPVGDPDGDWRVELTTGTVLVGELKGDALTVALPMGPKELTVPLGALKSLSLRAWAYPPPSAPVPDLRLAPTEPPPYGPARYDDGQVSQGGTDSSAEQVQAESMGGLIAAPARPRRGKKVAHAARGGLTSPSSAPVWFDKEPVETAKDNVESEK